jgi:hypothetical protein
MQLSMQQVAKRIRRARANHVKPATGKTKTMIWIKGEEP